MVGITKPGVKGEVTKDSLLFLSTSVFEYCVLTDFKCRLPLGVGGADGKNMGVVYG